jgi:hypothetical protein
MKINSLAASLHAQKELVASAALNTPDSDVNKRGLFKVADGLDRAARRAETPILDIPAMATPAEIQRARSRRAVRRGKDVYLPTWRELCTGMPNVLLRSALWSVTAIGHETDDEVVANPQDSKPDQVVPTQGDFRLINRGPNLGWYDRRVFAICLNHYRDERPLYVGNASSTFSEGTTWIQLSYFQFLESMGVAYSQESHISLRKSLERLSALSLHVRTRGIEVQMPRILEVSYADGEARGDAPKASDLIFFRAHAPIAELYGLESWTAVPHSALNAGKGLNSWLATYYSTHSKPYPVKLESLYTISGSVCTPSVFKSRLKQALSALSKPDVPAEIRVKDYDIDKTTLTVRLLRWH